MPQNLAGWLVRCFLSTFLIRFMSSLESSKSKTWKFSFNLSSFDVFGMTTVFRWIPHRRTTWATVFLYFSARFWHKRMWLLRQICFQGNFNTHTHTQRLPWELDHPKLILNQTIPCFPHHLQEECGLWQRCHASDRIWQENHVGSMGEFQSDSQQASLWNRLSNL